MQQNALERPRVLKLELDNKICSWACLSIGNEREEELGNCAEEEEQEPDACMGGGDDDGGGGGGGDDDDCDSLAEVEERDRANYCLHHSENVEEKMKVGPALLYQIQCD